MNSLFNKFQDKAQAAMDKLDKSGYASKLPLSHAQKAQQPLDAQGNPVGGGPSESADYPDGKGNRPLIMENFTNQLRALHNQYAPQGPPEAKHLQVLITNAKGLTLDYQAVARDSKALSKDFFLWGQDQEDDIKDVTDRLAYLNFVNGAISTTLSDRLDAARAPLKKLREAQTALGPRRTQRANLEAQITRCQNDPKMSDRLQDLQIQLRNSVGQDDAAEREVAELRRRAVKESEQLKWEAFREYSEKLCLLSQAASLLLDQIPQSIPTPNSPYNGKQTTAGIKSSLQSALDNWRPGTTTLQTSYDHHNIDTRSFGESHASELSHVSSYTDLQLQNESAGGFVQPGSKPQPSTSSTATPAPVNPALLNNSPAQIPAQPQPQPVDYSNVVSPALASDGHSSTMSPVPPVPTVADVGIPISAGPSGPGPSSGTLQKDAPPYSATGPGGGIGGFRSDSINLSPEDEKKRLEREERERVLAAGGSNQVGYGQPTDLGYGGAGGFTQPQSYAVSQQPAATSSTYESAEDEKKRIEREDREKILRGEASGNQNAPGGPPGGRGPPRGRGPPPSYT